MSLATVPAVEVPALDRSRLARMRHTMESDASVDALASLLSIAGNPVRLRILLYLSEVPQLCVGELAELLGMSMQAVSAHLTKMKMQGVLRTRRQARMIYYSIADTEVGKAFVEMRQAMLWEG